MYEHWRVDACMPRRVRLLRRFPCCRSYCLACYTYTQVCINVDYRHRPNSLYLVQESKSGRERESARERWRYTIYLRALTNNELVTPCHLGVRVNARTRISLEISRDFGRWNLLSLPHRSVVRAVFSSPSSRTEMTPKVRWHDDNLE